MTSLQREKGRQLDRVAALEARLARAEEGLEEEGHRREVRCSVAVVDSLVDCVTWVRPCVDWWLTV